MADLEPFSNLQQQSEAATIVTYLHDSTGPSASSEPSSRGVGLNLIARIFRGDTGKIIVIVLMPLTLAFMTNSDAPLSLRMRKFVFCSVSIGLAALLHRIWPASNIVPTRYSVLTDQIGAGFALIAFYGMIISFLPDYLQWIPLASVLMLLFISCVLAWID